MAKTPFTKQELKEFEDLLLTKKAEILNEIQEQNEVVGHDSDEPGDVVDMATELLEKEMHLSLTEKERHSLNEIDAALERIQNKTFGICVDSGEVINKTRLRAVPEARRTVVAQEKYDRRSRDKKGRNSNYTKQYNS